MLSPRAARAVLIMRAKYSTGKQELVRAADNITTLLYAPLGETSGMKFARYRAYRDGAHPKDY
jgi:hypothetical protein